MAEQSQAQVQQDLDVDAAMLEHAEALMTTGDRVDADMPPTPALTPPTDDEIAAAMAGIDDPDVDADAGVGDDSEEYDSAVDDTLEGEEESESAESAESTEFTDAMIAGDEVTGADLAEAEASEASEADLLAAMAPDSAPLAPHPPVPGSPESPFRKCDCLGTMPGRACIRCGGSRWTKSCTQKGCDGTGRISTPNRNSSGPPRVERCGFCMGRGLVPARGPEINEAQNLYNDAVAAEKQRKLIASLTDAPAPVTTIGERLIQRRKPVLPSAGKPKQKPKTKKLVTKKK